MNLGSIAMYLIGLIPSVRVSGPVAWIFLAVLANSVYFVVVIVFFNTWKKLIAFNPVVSVSSC
jgi:hypothetical protein